MAVAGAPFPPDVLTVVTAGAARAALDAVPERVVGAVRDVYRRLDHDGGVVSPRSAVLRPPAGYADRFMALPALVAGEPDAVGLKWIASQPANVPRGRPRASGVLVMSDPRSGCPLACLEAGAVSAARTAASAVVGLEALGPGQRKVGRLCVVGAGVIAESTLHLLTTTGWRIGECTVVDLVPARAQALARRLAEERSADTVAAATGEIEAAVRGADVVLFATSALAPHVHDAGPLDGVPLALHLSLRDLAPSICAGAVNVVDRPREALREATSLGLAAEEVGFGRLRIVTIGSVLRQEVEVPRDTTVVFAPFGTGALDVAVGSVVMEEVARAGTGIPIAGFSGTGEDPTP